MMMNPRCKIKSGTDGRLTSGGWSVTGGVRFSNGDPWLNQVRTFMLRSFRVGHRTTTPTFIAGENFIRAMEEYQRQRNIEILAAADAQFMWGNDDTPF